jgi:hypothetical protein
LLLRQRSREGDHGRREELFPFGEGTIMQMREQVLELEEFGTRIAAAAPEMTVTSEPSEPSATTLEMKVDLLLQAVSAMQRRLDSIDQTIARALSR